MILHEYHVRSTWDKNGLRILPPDSSRDIPNLNAYHSKFWHFLRCKKDHYVHPQLVATSALQRWGCEALALSKLGPKQMKTFKMHKMPLKWSKVKIRPQKSARGGFCVKNVGPKNCTIEFLSKNPFQKYLSFLILTIFTMWKIRLCTPKAPRPRYFQWTPQIA